MTIAVVGLWHLGAVTSAGLAELGCEVIGIDPDHARIEGLLRAQAPVEEPLLNETIARHLKQGHLRYTTAFTAITQASLVWITYDTPLDEADIADVDAVQTQIMTLFPCIAADSVVIISSQLPVGSTEALQAAFDSHFPGKNVQFIYSPENLCLGSALARFTSPDRIVMGIPHPDVKAALREQLPMFVDKMLFMSVASAEMAKHAINAFLANSIVFINELASVCEAVNANAADVARALKTDERIGPRAYLRPGHAFSGGTLARDVQYLLDKKKQYGLTLPLCDAILASNQAHKRWVHAQLTRRLGNLKHKTIALLGLTYKPGTNTLRRSLAMEIADGLHQQGARVQAFDPAIAKVPATVMIIAANVQEALSQADACVIATEWPVFRSVPADVFVTHLRSPHVVDASGYLAEQLSADPRIDYDRVGDVACY